MGAPSYLIKILANFIGDNLNMAVKMDLEQQFVIWMVVIPGNGSLVTPMGME
jgi:hypothetical protein